MSLGHRLMMVVTLKNHSGSLNSTTCINAVEPQHQLFHVSGQAPLGAITTCPQCPEGSYGAPQVWFGVRTKFPSPQPLDASFLVSLISALHPSLSHERTLPNHVSLTSMLNSSSPSPHRLSWIATP